MMSTISVVQMESGRVVNLPRDTMTYDSPGTPASPLADLLGDARSSRALALRIPGELFLVESGWSSGATRGALVLTALEEAVAA